MNRIRWLGLRTGLAGRLQASGVLIASGLVSDGAAKSPGGPLPQDFTHASERARLPASSPCLGSPH